MGYCYSAKFPCPYFVSALFFFYVATTLRPFLCLPPAADIPILLITTSGADPGKEMEELAEKTVGRGRYEKSTPESQCLAASSEQS